MGKSPIFWYGGKYYQAKDIIELFPPHITYVEVFGGAAHVLFKKPPSLVEVYNDINGDIVNFFRVLRTPQKAEQLMMLLQLTPYSRGECLTCRSTLHDASVDDVERARRWFVSLTQSFGGTFTGWSYSKKESYGGMSAAVYKWLGRIHRDLPAAVERLRTVQIENLDFRDIIPRYDSKDTLFYLDPPYIPDTRKKRRVYDYEMSLDDHRDLVNILLNIKGKAVLSGYDHVLYTPLLENGWEKVYLGKYQKRAIHSARPIQYGDEFVWIKR